MTQLFMHKDTERLIKRGAMGMGVNSPDSTYIEKGYYPVVDNKPVYDMKTQAVTSEFVVDHVAKVFNRVYTVTGIPAEEIFAKKKTLVERAIVKFIQSKVDEYNTANGLSFKDVYSCALYKDMTGYTHKDFCTNIWTWQTSVWEYLRQVQIDLLTGTRTVEPTMEELMLELPELVI